MHLVLTRRCRSEPFNHKKNPVQSYSSLVIFALWLLSVCWIFAPNACKWVHREPPQKCNFLTERASMTLFLNCRGDTKLNVQHGNAAVAFFIFMAYALQFILNAASLYNRAGPNICMFSGGLKNCWQTWSCNKCHVILFIINRWYRESELTP